MKLMKVVFAAQVAWYKSGARVQDLEGYAKYPPFPVFTCYGYASYIRGNVGTRLAIWLPTSDFKQHVFLMMTEQ